MKSLKRNNSVAAHVDETKEYYENADRGDSYEQRWGYINPIARAYWNMRNEEVFSNILARFDTVNHPPKILEVGVGFGYELSKFSCLGVPQTNLTGVDCVFERLRRAKSIFPSIHFTQQDGVYLGFADNSFDVVCQFTCVMHISSKKSQEAICLEMIRVLKPGGIIIWWDVAPPPERTFFVRSLSQMFSMKPLSAEWFSCIKQTLKIFFVSSYRRALQKTAHNKYTNPISCEDLLRIFNGFSMRVKTAGVDYEIFRNLWSGGNRALAQWLWRVGWCYHHCFAVIEKK